MHNKEAIEFIITNKNLFFKKWKKTYSTETIEDAINDVCLKLINGTQINPNNNLTAYCDLVIKTQLYTIFNKNKKYVDNESVYSSAANPECEFENLEEFQDQGLRLKQMHNHIATLPEKQKQSVLNVLNGSDKTANPNFKQAIRKLRDLMNGSTFVSTPGGKFIFKNIGKGNVGVLSLEAIKDIRTNIKFNKKGWIINAQEFAEKYQVSKRVVTRTARYKNYKNESRYEK